MNETQMEQFVRLYGADILRFCRITAGSTQEGDELYQDTMLLLWEKRGLLENTLNVKSYALSTALHLWKNRKRKAASRLRLVPQESLEELAEQGIQPGTEESASPEEILLQNQRSHTVRQQVALLPDKYRLPIQLYYSADLSIREISRILKLPENTVKSRLHRAKQTIRKKLEELEYDRSGI